MNFRIEELTNNDYPAAAALWTRCEGVGQVDSREAVAAFLQRNPGLSAVARDAARIDQSLAAAVMCGHDGRRGYLYHLAVAPEHRRRGLARQLIDHCTERLSVAGIKRCSAFVFCENEAARDFWIEQGWRQRSDLGFFAYDMP